MMKAIALISGGLDSTLAAKLMQNLDIELVCLNTFSPFCLCRHRGADGCFHAADSVAKQLGLKLITVDVTEDFLEIVKKPKHGYGSEMNPCIDCRTLLFKKAKELMQREFASFVITGEVLGQRPMSQRLNTLYLIEKEAGLSGLVLRPLSAGALKPTIPEEQGWVKRDKLLSFTGRTRKPQIALAQEFGIKDYPCPSGGCLLTDPGFSRRLKDLMQHGEFSINDIYLLKLGRHFRLTERAKLVVGRNERENKSLLSLARDDDYLFTPALPLAGPSSIGRGIFDAKLLELSCRIACRYCDLNRDADFPIFYRRISQKREQILRVLPLVEPELLAMRV